MVICHIFDWEFWQMRRDDIIRPHLPKGQTQRTPIIISAKRFYTDHYGTKNVLKSSLQDLKKQLDDLNIGIQSISTDNATVRSIIEESMKKEIEKLEGKIANPPSEIRSDIEKIKSEMAERNSTKQWLHIKQSFFNQRHNKQNI